MSYCDEQVSFRFFDLTKEEADALKAHIANAELRPQRKDPGKYVVALPWMNPEEDYSWLEHLIQKHKLSEEKYGFFFSLVTADDHGIITMPKFVRVLFRRIGGQLDFSFTASGGYIDGVYDPIAKAARSVA